MSIQVDRLLSNSDSAPRIPLQHELPASRHLALGLTVALLVALSFRTLLPLWLPLVLAAWFAELARPLSRRLARWLHGKERAAAVVAVLLVIFAMSPLVLLVLSLAEDASRLVEHVLASPSVEGAFRSLVNKENGTLNLESVLATDPARLLGLIRQSGTSALGFASSVAGATLSIIIGLVVFVTGFYIFLVDGLRLGAWLERNLPLTRRQFRGFANAFYETGRGLLFGVGLTALVQGAIAGVGYVVVGVPHAFVFAMLTAVAALVPSVGTGLVWLPVGVTLLVTGDVSSAMVILVMGTVAGLADNFLRPALSRFGRLCVPTFVIFCAMLGGLVAFGAPGILLGPLFVRMTMEGLRLWRRRDAPVVITPHSSPSPG